MAVYFALMHYPVYNRNNEIITTAITNLDIHDIARVASTFGVAGYFIVHPEVEQKALAKDSRTAEEIVNEVLENGKAEVGIEANKDNVER